MTELKDIKQQRDPNLFQKQNQLYIWIRYKIFVTYKNIQKVCFQLIEGESQEVRQWYGQTFDEEDDQHILGKNNPIYKIFYPLYYLGIFEKATLINKDKLTHGFVLSKHVPLLPNSFINSNLEYRNHFVEQKQGEKYYSQEDIQESSLKLLKSMPTLKSIIETWVKIEDNENLINYKKRYIIKNGWIQQDYGRAYGENCIYKGTNEVYSLGNIYVEKEAYRIPEEDIDAINIAKTYIAIKNNALKIEYQDNQLFFKCNPDTLQEEFGQRFAKINWYNNLPIIIFRALTLFNVEQLTESFSYDKNRYYNREYHGFSNIPNEAINELNRIFEINIQGE